MRRISLIDYFGTGGAVIAPARPLDLPLPLLFLVAAVPGSPASPPKSVASLELVYRRARANTAAARRVIATAASDNRRVHLIRLRWRNKRFYTTARGGGGKCIGETATS